MERRETEEQKEIEELPKVDALIVLGRNFQPGFNKKTLAEQRFHLSHQSRINALVAGTLYKAGYTDTLILSTGHTGGSNLPSEAEAMKKYIQGIFKDIPDYAFLLEEDSIDTDTNAKKVKKIAKQHPEFSTFGLVTDTSHLKRAVPAFERNELAVYPFDSLKILGKSRPDFIKNYIYSTLYQETIEQDLDSEMVGTLPVVSPVTSRLLHLAALYARNPNKPNPYVK